MSDHGLEDNNVRQSSLLSQIEARLADEYPSPDTSRPLTLPTLLQDVDNEEGHMPESEEMEAMLGQAGHMDSKGRTQHPGQDAHERHGQTGRNVPLMGVGSARPVVLGIGVGVQPHVEEMATNTSITPTTSTSIPDVGPSTLSAVDKAFSIPTSRQPSLTPSAGHSQPIDDSATPHASSNRSSSHGRALHTFYTPTPQAGRVPSSDGLTHAEQIKILRDAFLVNPLPNRRELQELAEKTGRDYVKVREYFRQRRNKGRGIEMLEELEEPARAAGWLSSVYKAAPPEISVPQLNLYSAYKTRFDPYSQHTPLLGGQELIQMALATFPGCEMARDEGEYVLKGMGEREQAAASTHVEDGQDRHRMEHTAIAGDQSEVDRDTLQHALERIQAAAEPSPPPQVAGAGPSETKALDTLVEPLRATSWLLGEYDAGQGPAGVDADGAVHGGPQDQAPGGEAVTQAELYTSYTNRFTDHDINDQSPSTTAGASQPRRPPRMLNPVELLQLVRITFPTCEPAIDDAGRFVVRGLEKRASVRDPKVGDMFPFALVTEPTPSDPLHPLTSLVKRKLAQSVDDADGSDAQDTGDGAGRRDKRARVDMGVEMTAEDKQLVEGLQRFRRSKLGQQVRDVCVSQ